MRSDRGVAPVLDPTLLEWLTAGPADDSVVFLTGAGISAESGIPTFRGPEGYWTVGSREYHPMELATRAAFEVIPDEVWRWYLYRRGVCRDAAPNAAHEAIARLERSLGDRFTLLTQNVDGLHLRAGNSLERCFQVHGNLDYMRCARECSTDLDPVPTGLAPWPRDRALDAGVREQLRCGRCGAPTRPHVLWFDECYDEEFFRADSSLCAARAADLLVVIGTAGQTNLPLQVGSLVVKGGGAVVDINLEDNPFARMAAHADRGFVLRGTSGDLVPPLVDALVGRT